MRSLAIGVALAVAVASLVPSPATGVSLVSHSVVVRYVSQLAEPAPRWWSAGATPYCAAAASLTVMGSFGVTLPASPLQTTFAIGRSGNTTNDPGLDPDGISHLMRSYGGDGPIHAYWDRGQALNELIGRLNHNAPVVALTQAGNHAVTVYGYQARQGGAVTGLYVADPLTGFMGLVPVERWLWWHHWMGSPFSAPGVAWRGGFVFVGYRDFRGSASAPAAHPVAAGAPVVPAERPFRSVWVSQSAYPQLAPGEIGRVTVVLRNVGTSAWVRGTATEARLGIPHDDGSHHARGLGRNWILPARPAVQLEDNVMPSQFATFSFEVIGVAGSHLIPLRPVIDGTGWLDDQGIHTIVTVR